MKKGFTIVELLAVIAIIAIILLMAVPTYSGIVFGIRERTYETKVSEVLAKSEAYAEESGKIVFHIKQLIDEGVLAPDNEAGEFKDPRDGSDMRCDIVNIRFTDTGYQAEISKSLECLSKEELENLHGIANLKLVKSEIDPSELESFSGTDFSKSNTVSVTYELKDNFREYTSNIESILWYGDGVEEKTCDSSNISNCKFYTFQSDEIKNAVLNTEVHFVIRLNINGIVLTSESTKSVMVDNEYPIMLDGSLTKDDEYNANSERRIHFELTDKNGSGVQSLAVVEYHEGERLSCNVTNYKETSEGIQTVYLGSGFYYICAKDKVGNVIDDETLNADPSKYIIKVDHINTEGPKWLGDENERIKVESQDTRFDSLQVNVQVNVENGEGGTEGLQVCISGTGYLQGCEWKDYVSTTKYPLTLNGDYDGGSRMVYVVIQDKYGNTLKGTKDYTVYKQCADSSLLTGKQYTSDYGGCSKSCGGGLQYRNYVRKDIYTNAVCVNDKDSRACNTHSCDPVESMNPNDYNSSKEIACNATYFTKLLTDYASKFKTSLDYQPFRNAIFDCGAVTSSIIKGNSAAWSAMRYHSRTIRVDEYSVNYTSNKDHPGTPLIYAGKAYVFSYSQNTYYNNGSSATEYAFLRGKKPDGSSWSTGYVDADLTYARGTGGNESGYGEMYKVGQFVSNIYPDIQKFFSSGYNGRKSRFYAYVFQI